METSRIIHQGKLKYRKSKIYRRRKQQVKMAVNKKYRELIQAENNIIKKLLIYIKKYQELSKELSKIDPNRMFYGSIKKDSEDDW